MTSNIMDETNSPMVMVRTDSGQGEAWHVMGSFIGNKTAKEGMDTFADGVPVFEKQPTYFVNDEGAHELTGDFAILRKPVKNDLKTRVMGYCTDKYNIVQPWDITKAFDAEVKQPVETLGFIGKGEKAFLTWTMPRSIIVGGSDEVKTFGTIMAGFDGKVSISLSLLCFRTLCENTFNMAQSVIKSKKSDGTSEGRLWVGRHNSPNILRDLSAWMGHVQMSAEAQLAMTENLFNKLDSTPVDDKNVLKSLIEAIYPLPAELGFYPESIRQERQDKLDKEISKADADRVAIEMLFGGGDKTTQGNTAWDLFNNVTYYENHVRLSKKDTASSICFGNRSDQMNDALLVLADYAKNF